MMKDSKDSGSISLLVSFFFLHLILYLDKDTGRCRKKNETKREMLPLSLESFIIVDRPDLISQLSV